MPRIFTEPAEVQSEPDQVKVIRDDFIEYNMTPEAAVRTAGRLVAESANAIAKGKRRRRSH
jgi:hypothetical protein